MVADPLQRKKQLVTDALNGKLEFPPYFHFLAKDNDREELSNFIRNHSVINALGTRAHTYNLPNEITWRESAQYAFGQLHYAQMLPESDSRRRQILQCAEAVVSAEQKFDANNAKATPGWIRPTVQGSIDIHPSDQIVTADANVSVRKLCQQLEQVGQTLPTVSFADDTIHYARLGMQMSLQSAIALNLPHALEAQCGNWRDWILGMTIMLADGSIVKSGSKVVKNVAGYDVHKMLVGARGTLALILDVTLKTIPKDALPKHAIEIRRRVHRLAGPENRMPTLWIQRTKPSDFDKAVNASGDKILEIDWASSTLWADVLYEDDLPRYPDDWVVRRGCDEKNFHITNPATILLMKRAKQMLDPENKFNPGAMGVV